MEPTQDRAVIKYLKKKCMIAKEIHEDMVPILVENSSSNKIVTKEDWKIQAMKVQNRTLGSP